MACPQRGVGLEIQQAPLPSAAPSAPSQNRLQSQPHLHLFNHLKQICVLQQRRGREQVSPQGVQLILLSPQGVCTQPSHLGPPSSDQPPWTCQPRAWAPEGQLTPFSPLPQRRKLAPQIKGCDPWGQTHLSHVTTRLAVPGLAHGPLRRAPGPSPREEPSWDPQEGL